MSEPIAYHIIRGGDRPDTVVAFDPGSDKPILEADSSHPHWVEIVRLLEQGDRSVIELFDVQGGVMSRLRRLSDRVEYDGTNVLWDGDPINSTLSNQIKRFLEAGSPDYYPLIRFWEKIAENPDPHSKEQLFDWLKTHDFTITQEGDIVGYKAVLDINGALLSSHSGLGYVNGKELNGRIPNEPGTVVSIPRSKVNANPDQGCSYGLHVGDWTYVSSFLHNENNKVTLEVHVHPRDVVSIPAHSQFRKMRVAKYKVIQRIGKHYDATVRPKSNLIDVPAWQGDVGYKV